MKCRYEEYRRRPIAATETDAEWYANLYEVGWPDARHRAIHNSTAKSWEAAGRPAPGSRPGEGEVIAHFASSEPILRYSPAPRWLERPGRSRRYRCGRDKALRSPNNHSPLRKSWPNSSHACSPHPDQGFASRRAASAPAELDARRAARGFAR